MLQICLISLIILNLPMPVYGETEPARSIHPWRPPAAEQALLNLDLNGPNTFFDLLGDQEGASIIFRVRQAQSREKLAVIKLDSRHSQASAEVFAWRMACYLGFPDIVTPAAAITLQGGAILKLRRLFLELSYQDPDKERIRLEIVSNLSKASAGQLIFSGVIKPWLTCFMFTEELGTLGEMIQSPTAQWLKHDGFPPGNDDYILRQRTRLYKPMGIHQGSISKKQLTLDMSNIMVLDALMGQSDRFAGANLHFWNNRGQRTELPAERGKKVWEMGQVRLLALDNGLAFRGRNGNGLFDLQGLAEPGSRVERFDRETVDRIRELGKAFLVPANNSAPNSPHTNASWAYFGLNPKQFSLAGYYLKGTLNYIDSLEKFYSYDIYLND